MSGRGDADDVWQANAAAWTDAVRGRRIASRAVTDHAVVRAVADLRPRRVLDLGCGEGWLTRRLREEFGCEVLGVDGSARLIEAASAADPQGSYVHAGYGELIAGGGVLQGKFDTAVFNFALLDRDIAPILGAAASRLAPEGAVIVQTLHPWAAAGKSGYADGWRTETFVAFGGGAAWRPMRWYFRTLESWLAALAEAGLKVESCSEPWDPRTGLPLSLLLTCRAA